jgi:hypothetical protein
MMASLDLSAAFDAVNVQLLLKRLRIVGLKDDLVTLVSTWLKSRYFCVTIDGKSSYIHQLKVGTVQGSILGPLLYAIYGSPLFDLADMTNFAGGNYVIR